MLTKFKIKYTSALFLLLSPFFSFNVNAEAIEEGRQYFPVKTDIAQNKSIVLFISFASEDSYDLIVNKNIVKRLMDKGLSVSVYNVDFFSPQDKEYGVMWSALNSYAPFDAKKFEMLKNIFKTARQDRVVGTSTEVYKAISDLSVKSVVSDDDIKLLANPVTTSASPFLSIQSKLMKDLDVTSVPSLYINGRYLINVAYMNGFENDESVRKYLETIDYLRNKS